MKSTKTTYIFLAVIAILVWNVVIAKRDQEMFKQYDAMCATMKSDYRCKYSM